MTACASWETALAELALGTLPGDERAGVLAHVATCPGCQAALEDLARTADALLQMAPAVEPPVGFESRVLAGLTPAVPRRSRLFRVVAAAAAVVLVGGLGFGLGRMVAHQAPAPAMALRVGHLANGGHARGSVVVAGRRPAWLIMSLEDAGGTASVECRLIMRDGHVMPIGWFHVDRGYAEWTSALAVNPDKIRSTDVVGPDGVVLASATLGG